MLYPAPYSLCYFSVHKINSVGMKKHNDYAFKRCHYRGTRNGCSNISHLFKHKTLLQHVCVCLLILKKLISNIKYHPKCM